jgi:hypothetical protein
MPAPRWRLLLAAALLLPVPLVMVLTVYTGPIIDPDRDGAVERLLHQALGDDPATPPAWTGGRGLELGTALPGRDTTIPVPPPPALAWALAAVRTDSAAVRGWLSPAVLELGGIAGDSVRLTLFRLTLRKGCPLVSRLHAVLSGELGDLQVDRMESSCPRVTTTSAGPDGSV